MHMNGGDGGGGSDSGGRGGDGGRGGKMYMNEGDGCGSDSDGTGGDGGCGGGVGGINPQACAACILRGASCDESCELAPYFPASRYYEFLIANSYYGIDDIIRILNSIEPYRRQEVVQLILFECNVRYIYLLHIIWFLVLQLRYYESELEAVKQQLAVCREIQRQRQQVDNSVASSSSTVPPSLEPANEDISMESAEPDDDGEAKNDNSTMQSAEPDDEAKNDN